VVLDLFTADFSILTGADLYTAIVDFTRCNLPPEERTQEGYTVDFKEKWSERSLRVIAAFANTFGGIVVVGVSEDKGRANEIVGEQSKGELKTRLAAAIAASITPTPSFDIGECEVPGATERRLCVIRVRPTNRIHFLTTKDAPVYVRNEDQALPARAAELRSLIIRDRDLGHSGPRVIDQNRIFQLLPITKRRSADAGQKAAQGRIAADSVLRVWIAPEQKCKLSLDYNTELIFRDIVFKTFPKDSFAEDSTWNSSEDTIRQKSFCRIDYAHLDRDLESKWLFTDTGEFGYASVLSLDLPVGKSLWSLPDLTVELIASIRAAHAVLTNIGYLGEAQIDIWANPGAGELYVERGGLPFLRHSSCGVNATSGPLLQQMIPKGLKQQAARSATASVSSNFHTRTECIAALVADLLNQFLRDLGCGAVLAQLREHAKAMGG
jgi:hypothetical protein